MANRKRKKDIGRLRGDSGHHRRIFVVMAVLGIAAFVPVALRLYSLMVGQYDYYSRLALRNQTRTTQITAARGTVYDRNMNILAISETVENVFLDPHELKQSGADVDALALDLGTMLDRDPLWIAEQARDITKRYKQIAAKIGQELASQIRNYINEKGISGIHLEPDTKRYYPCGTLAAQVIGFTNASNTGAEGIEAAYNSYLEGVAGKVITTKGNNEMDMPFSYENYVATQPGCH